MRNRFSSSDFAYTFLRSVVCLSVCRLSHSCTTLKPFDGLEILDAIWQVASTPLRPAGLAMIAGSNDTLCYRGRGNFRVEPQTKSCICLLMIHQSAAPISDFAFYRIPSVTCFVIGVVFLNENNAGWKVAWTHGLFDFRLSAARLVVDALANAWPSYARVCN